MKNKDKPRVRVIKDVDMSINDTLDLGVFFGEAPDDQGENKRKENENGG